MRTTRLIAAAALLIGGTVLTIPSHAAQPVPCAPESGRFQKLDAGPFGSGQQTITGIAVDATGPDRVYVTNGAEVRATQDGGCHWKTVFASTNGRIAGISTAFSPRVQVVVDSGRPRVYWSLGGLEPFTEGGDGLPIAGTPRQLTASRGHQADWLLVEPALAGRGSGGGIQLPVLGQPPAPTGSLSAPLFRSDDGGAHWASAQTSQTFDRILADDGSDSVLWAVRDGELMVSSDNAKTFRSMGLDDVTELAPAGPSRVVAVAGRSLVLVPGFGAKKRITLDGAVLQVAVRGEDPQVALVVTDKGYDLVDLTTGQHASVPAPGIKPASLLIADASPSGGAYIGTVGRTVLRWVDEAPSVVLNTGHVGPVRLQSASLLPTITRVRVPVGQSSTVTLALHLPPNPTPVDLMFLVDVSYSMDPALEQLKDGLFKAAQRLLAAGVDLRLGLATIGTQSKSHGPDPAIDPLTAGYRKPVVYRLIDPIGDPDRVVRDLQTIDIEKRDIAHQSDVRVTGTAAAIDQLLTGSGIRDPYNANLTYAVGKGAVPHWRGGSARKVLAVITGSPVPDPEGQTMGQPAGGLPDLISKLRDQQIRTIGLTPRTDDDTLASLATLARGTGALAERGPVDCDGDGAIDIKANAPLACVSVTGLPTVVAAAVESLRDFQPLKVLGHGVAQPLPLSVSSLDAFASHDVLVPVSVSCEGRLPTIRTGSVVAQFRREAVAQASLVVTCYAPPILAAPVVLPPAPAAPVAAVNPPPAPANPAQQVQNQPQLNPQPGAAAQNEEEAELVAATNDVEGAAEDSEGEWVLGMSAIVASAGTVATMRRRRRVQVATSHVRNIDLGG